MVNIKNRSTIVAAFLVLIAAGVASVFATDSLLGKKPTQKFTAAPAELSFEEPLHQARFEVEKDPNNLDARRGLATLLFSKLSTVARDKEAERFDVLELLDTLSVILKQEPADRGAMLMMGDLSFREQVYDKAALYYEKYLRTEPKDYQVRAKYGGALAYIGKNEKAHKELLAVVKAQPTYFPAKVYLGVAKVGLGKKEEAIMLLQEAATQVGPTSQAGVEIGRLIQKVQGKESPPQDVAPQYSSVEALLRAHSVVGPKLDRVVEQEEVLKLYVHDFPVAQMPEFAREKLLGRIRDFYKKSNSDVEHVEFYEQSSSKLLASYELS